LRHYLSTNKKYGLLVFPLLMIAFLVACYSHSRIFAVVYDEVTKKPIEGAKVSFFLVEGRTDIVFTNESGFAVTGWSGGPMNIRITVEKTDYVTKEIIIDIREFTMDYNGDSYTNIDIYLSPIE
jgi:hypothetical protein